MSEELRVYCPLGYGATVDGEIFLTPAWRVVVYDAGQYLFSDAALSDDEDREVGRGYLKTYVKGTVQLVAVAHDTVFAFYFL